LRIARLGEGLLGRSGELLSLRGGELLLLRGGELLLLRGIRLAIDARILPARNLELANLCILIVGIWTRVAISRRC